MRYAIRAARRPNDMLKETMRKGRIIQYQRNKTQRKVEENYIVEVIRVGTQERYQGMKERKTHLSVEKVTWPSSSTKLSLIKAKFS